MQPIAFSLQAFSMSLQERQHFQEEADLDNLVFNILKAYEEIRSGPEAAFQAQSSQK